MTNGLGIGTQKDNNRAVMGSTEPSPEAFVSTWRTTNTSTGSSNSDQVMLPFKAWGSYNCTVYWGDGNSDVITSWNQAEATHTYASSGDYEIIIVPNVAGGLTGWQFLNTGDRYKLLNISQWGEFLFGTNQGYWFQGCINMTITASDAPDLSLVTTMLMGFGDCYALTDGLSNWDVSNISVFTQMFFLCSTYNEDLPWNTASATQMSQTFRGCTVFNGDITSWNTGNVTTMSLMFYDALAFNQPIGNWDVSKTMFFAQMFFNCYVFNRPLNSWNMGMAIDTSSMFYNCYLFNQDLNSWDTSKVILFTNMFRNCYAFNGNITSWNTAKVTNMSYMFNNAVVFNQNISGWNTGLVTAMNNMFQGNVGALTIFNKPIGSWNTANVTVANNMFAYSEFNQPINAWNTAKFTSLFQMFYFNPNFNQDLNSWNTGLVINSKEAFRGATAFNGNITSWNMANVTDMSFMFYGAAAFNQAIGSWNVGKVTTMQGTFGYTANFNQSLSWTMTLCTRMDSMFIQSGISNADLSGMTFPICTNMSNMFNNAFNFDGSTIGGWNISSITGMNSTFRGASSFNNSLTGWDVDQVTNMTLCFNSTGLTTANYDALLIAWAAKLPFHASNRTISFSPTKYTGANPTVVTARDALVAHFTTAFVDGGSV